MECDIINRFGHPELGPAYPPPTITWKKDNVTVIKNGRLTEEFDRLYPELMLFIPFPINIGPLSGIRVDFRVFNASGIDAVPVNCSNHFVYAEWRNYILYSIVGKWQCMVENIYGVDTGELTIMEAGKQGYGIAKRH